MYVCNCNGLTERDVRTSIEGGSRSCAEVYRAHDCQPQCGKCVREVRQFIRDGAPSAAGAR